MLGLYLLREGTPQISRDKSCCLPAEAESILLRNRFAKKIMEMSYRG